MKRWITAILSLVMLSQALPWTAFASTGNMITQAELLRALQLAGLQSESNAQSDENALFAAASAKDTFLRLEARESGYHPGMKPDETWDAQMLMDWVDDKLSRDIYNVTSVFTRAETRLERMKTEDPAAWARFTEGAENAEYMAKCHDWVLEATSAEQDVRYFRDRLSENTVLIEQNTETLANHSEGLFDYEKARLSAQIREATQALEELRYDILGFSLGQMLIFITAQFIIDGMIEPEFSAWLKAVLASEDGAEEVTVPASYVMSTGYKTLASRMAPRERVLAAGNSQDVSVNVISENQFAFVFRGVNNQYVGGVKVTVKDVNGSVEKTLTTDDKYGSVIFDANDFVCDYDKEMELSLTVSAEALGYRDFNIPWLIMKRGGKRTETLVLLTGPETRAEAQTDTETRSLLAAGNGEAKPYVYSCYFNGYDILRQDHEVIISRANNADHSFELTVSHAIDKPPRAPVLHYQALKEDNSISEEKTASPTSVENLSFTRTKYIYTDTWKRILFPDVPRDKRPYFVLPDTNEVVETQLIPIHSAVSTPGLAGTEPNSPLTQAFQPGLGVDFTIPVIGGRLSIDLPWEDMLPKVLVNPEGYVTITMGSSLVDPKKHPGWRTREKVAYDRDMKDYQHLSSVAQCKQKWNTAKQYYKKFDPTGMGNCKFDLGVFIMLAGRIQDDNDRMDKSTLWSSSGMAGISFFFNADYTISVSLGPVPVYTNIGFSASLGFGVSGLMCTFYTDQDSNFKDMTFDILHGLTVTVRLALTLTCGVGMRGVASIWASATGAMQIILHFITAEPPHVAVYLELFVTVGIEFFFARYSRVMCSVDPYMIYENYKLSTTKAPSLFAAYSAEAEDSEDEITPLSYEPENYAALSPETAEVLSNLEGSQTGVRLVSARNHVYAFYFSGKGTERRVSWMDLKTGITQDSHWFTPYFLANASSYYDYGYDVISDGNQIILMAVCAKRFDENGLPVVKSSSDASQVYCMLLEAPIDSPNAYLYRKGEVFTSSMLQTIGDIRLDDMSVDSGNNYSVQGCYTYVKPSGEIKKYNKFTLANSFTKLLPTQISATSSAVNKPRVGLRTFMRYDDPKPLTNIISRNYANGGWIAVDRSEDDPENSALEVWLPGISDNNSGLILDRGNIQGYALFQSRSGTKDRYDHTIFYTKAETLGERTENRLKGIYIAPKADINKNDTQYNVVYTDYDLSIPASEFYTMTMGASRYLYWLSSVTKAKESDPDTWRINGVYYDPNTGYVTDQIVMAEFTLPDVQWNGTTCKSVPAQILLTETGTGYIVAKPNNENPDDKTVPPMTAYSFPLNLKALMSLRGATLTETTVCQGELISADMSLMNEGNMGIGSFDVELWLTENGEEKKLVETLYADCLKPENSRLVLHTDKGDETVATGKAAFYRLKDFDYSPRQREWLINHDSKTFKLADGKLDSTVNNRNESIRFVTDVLVPGALGGYTAALKIPTDWKGEKTLRLKVTRFSTYNNWLAAAALAQAQPARFAAMSSEELAENDLVELVYNRDDDSDRMVLEQSEALFAAAERVGEAAALYAASVDAPRTVDVDCQVNDIDVSHRLFQDYYGEDMLEITISDYCHSQEPIQLTCSVYVNGSTTPANVSLPYDPDVLSTGKTTTITVPLAALVDIDTTEKARFIINPRGITETARVNNEFTVYPGGKAEITPLVIAGQPQSTVVPIGERVLFNVGVTGGKAPYSYQWQVFTGGEWKDLPSENAATLTLDKARLEWNGRRTRCVITDANGTTVVSDEAVLTVTGTDATAGNAQPDTGDHMRLPLYLAVALIAIILLVLLRRRERD